MQGISRIYDKQIGEILFGKLIYWSNIHILFRFDRGVETILKVEGPVLTGSQVSGIRL